MGTSWVAVSINNIKTRASSEMTSRKNIKIFDFNGVNLPSTGMWRGEVFAISDCLVIIVAVTGADNNTICLLKRFINQHSVWPVAYYSQLEAYSQSNTRTKSLLMYTYFNTLYPQTLISLYSQHVCFPQKLKPKLPEHMHLACVFPKTRETP